MKLGADAYLGTKGESSLFFQYTRSLDLIVSKVFSSKVSLSSPAFEIEMEALILVVSRHPSVTTLVSSGWMGSSLGSATLRIASLQFLRSK